MLRLGAIIAFSTALAGTVFSPTLTFRDRQAEAPAAAETSLRVSETSGYGIDSCLNESGGCQMAVAYAWCEAHGLTHVTAVKPAANGRDLTVSCGK
ncbi:hypothetical protein MAE02_38500 [Microvirga aerophila]|uniref:Uncharacterized protein n=1 Tax=Microvirga aerophila TaxID=670291 RepID=A0A512BW18_9HYPH|nr:hypothetical protein MAE02_38500 [Microvirga aerophila]